METGIPILDKETDLDYEKKISSENSLIQKWKKSQQALNHFWNLWKNHYLLSLRERYQRSLKKSKGSISTLPQVGYVVLIKDNLPRGSWRLGRIIELMKSSDGEIRSARVRLPNGRIIRRPLNLLCYLEGTNPTEEQNKQIEKDSGKRPTMRAAAIKAKENLKSLFEDDVN
ncbi:MAG: hypothetical protein FD188_3218 [Ignavibacteria bacterium]|nr:MAG: hypothetical protein FD188_3218 [Ignavibacteria bacterium]